MSSEPMSSNGSSETPTEPEGTEPSSSTSKSTGSESPSLKGDRVLRWQVEMSTTAHPSKDEQTERELYRKLEIAFGSNIKITKLRTKEHVERPNPTRVLREPGLH